MKVSFLGNHTVGVTALKAIAANEDIVSVVAHPFDPEDGVLYDSVYDYATQMGWNTIRSNGKGCSLEDFIKKSKPDLIWVTDYRYLLPLSLINLAPLGAVNLHPSLLPKYRGRASINWAILKGEEELGLTAHFIDEGTDSGDIIEQIRFKLSEDQDIGNALELLYPLYERLTYQVLKYFHLGDVPRYSQKHNDATIFPRRKPDDGLIDWDQPAKRVQDLIRAVAHPYPGAFSFWHGHKILIWSATLYLGEISKGLPGEVLRSDSNNFVVSAKDGAILVKYAELDSSKQHIVLSVGERLGKESS
jgi:methionyl-tRNA formyltransferase